MGYIRVDLPQLAWDALITLALREYRQPRAQAEKFIVEGLQAVGALPPLGTPHETDCYGEAW